MTRAALLLPLTPRTASSRPWGTVYEVEVTGADGVLYEVEVAEDGTVLEVDIEEDDDDDDDDDEDDDNPDDD